MTAQARPDCTQCGGSGWAGADHDLHCECFDDVAAANRCIAIILTDAGIEGDLYLALLASLVEHEDQHLEQLTLAGASQGLMPSITRLTLVTSGLGSAPDDGTLTLLRMQASMELAQIQEQIRRYHEGGGE